MKVVPVIATYDGNGNILPLYVRIGEESFKIYNAYVSHGYNVSAISGCQDLLVIIVGLSQLRNKLSDENFIKSGDTISIPSSINIK